MSKIKKEIEIGQQFGKLTVISKADSILENNGKKRGAWLCQCECGNQKIVKTANLNAGKTKSCGCLHPNNEIISPGQKFGKLTTFSFEKGSWDCICDCGNHIKIKTNKLRNGIITLCENCKLEEEKRLIESKTKICAKCNIDKNKLLFSKNKYKKDGLNSWCKDCYKQYSIDNKDIISEKNKKSYEDNIEERTEKRLQKDNHEKYLVYIRTPTARYNGLISKSKRRNISCTLTFDEYWKVASQPCYYSNNQLGSVVEVGSGLDRLDSNKGYECGNIVSCCKSCNQLKTNLFTPQETKIMINALLEFRNTKQKADPLQDGFSNCNID